jgi:hypothetical protein
MSRAVILGAGFSAGVSPRMPMTGRLGELVLDRLADQNVTVPDRRFSGPQL